MPTLITKEQRQIDELKAENEKLIKLVEMQFKMQKSMLDTMQQMLLQSKQTQERLKHIGQVLAIQTDLDFDTSILNDLKFLFKGHQEALTEFKKSKKSKKPKEVEKL